MPSLPSNRRKRRQRREAIKACCDQTMQAHTHIYIYNRAVEATEACRARRGPRNEPRAWAGGVPFPDSVFLSSRTVSSQWAMGCKTSLATPTRARGRGKRTALANNARASRQCAERAGSQG
eukprot:2308143-Alexandrium_andersonii.AAC.1